MVISDSSGNMETVSRDPFRLFFPVGILFLLIGLLIWVPRIWNPEDYPVLMHRGLVLNGFAACFVGGFLLTAVPRFSQTDFARPWEIGILSLTILVGVCSGHFENEPLMFLASGGTGLFLLFFVLRRIRKRKANPPYSFLFLFLGLILWTLSGIGAFFGAGEEMKELHYHGSLMAIILGVGSRLLPGIMGHAEIVSAQREHYEAPVPLLKTVPLPFFALIFLYVISFFLPGEWSVRVPAIIVTIIGFTYWKIHSLPRERTALTKSLWITAWLIILSYILRAVWTDGAIHLSHAFFINGIVLLSLLVATRVIQSHGPKDKELENWKGLYFVTFLIFFASATRVSAFLLPEQYLTHLGYGSVLLVLAILIWSGKYLRYVREVPK